MPWWYGRVSRLKDVWFPHIIFDNIHVCINVHNGCIDVIICRLHMYNICWNSIEMSWNFQFTHHKWHALTPHSEQWTYRRTFFIDSISNSSQNYLHLSLLHRRYQVMLGFISYLVYQLEIQIWYFAVHLLDLQSNTNMKLRIINISTRTYEKKGLWFPWWIDDGRKWVCHSNLSLETLPYH